MWRKRVKERSGRRWGAEVGRRSVGGRMGIYLGIYNTTTRQHDNMALMAERGYSLYSLHWSTLHLSAPPCTSLHLSVLSIPYASSHLFGVVLFRLPLAVSLRRTHEPSKLFDDQSTPLHLHGEGALRDLSLRHLMRLGERRVGGGGWEESVEREREREKERKYMCVCVCVYVCE